MKEEAAYLRALAKRDSRIRFMVTRLFKSKAEVGRLFGVITNSGDLD